LIFPLSSRGEKEMGEMGEKEERERGKRKEGSSFM
jgi:hypothetical protein